MPSQEMSTADKDSKEQKECKDLVDGKDILIYPNPVSSEFTIVIPNLDVDEFASLMLYDQSGRLIYQIEKATMSNIINLADQSPGVYFLNIHIGDINVQWKIIKE